LVAKLKENNKRVIGVGVKDSTSDLLSGACHEFIYYDDLVRAQEAKQRASRRATAKPTAQAKRAVQETDDDKRIEAMEFLVDTVEDLINERGSDEKIWGSMVKPTMQRRRPGFNESYYGYRTFKELVEDADKRKMVVMMRDEKSGQYTIRLPASR
ncbi:MAG: NYN domain-containing protein, partial [Betaproteobacteria bacterium]